MGFVKTSQEIEQLQQVLSAPQARDGEMLWAQFNTDPEFIAHVLPPGLVPGKAPLASVNIGHWKGSNAGAFYGAAVFVNARTKQMTETEADCQYCLAFFVSDDQASLFGRPMMGEPKKLADIKIDRSENQVTASVTRYGKTIISLQAQLANDVGNAKQVQNALYFKHVPAANGIGLEYDPILVRQVNTQTLTRVVLGDAAETSVAFASTLHDPLGDIPVLGGFTSAYSEGSIYAEVSAIDTVDRESFLPYAFAAYDDWTTLVTE
ncbi:MAG: acetoacetate decarboxylase family protein [Proteobacteria bacterium]|jgi:acetoacetate decarboxylase|nr:acetoacetate decarboxylase family protein [Pseudomonadota bacterium]